MKTKTEKNTFLNFLYRIFIEAEPIEESLLNMESNDPTERALAESQAKIDEKYAKPSGKGGKGSKFKVEESELIKEENGKEPKQFSKEDKEMER